MNENIKRIAEQTGVTHKLDLGVYQFYEKELEDFVARLILECAEICVQNKHYNKWSVASDWAIKGASAFKEHFGVEQS